MLPKMVLQLMAGSARIEIAIELIDGGSFFLSFYKIPVEALCYGGILCKNNTRTPLGELPFVNLL